MVSGKDLTDVALLIADRINDGDVATQLLVGSLVSFLAKKGVIDINEYIEFTEQTKKSITTDSEALNERIEIYFNSHINDLRKPE